MVEVIYKDGRGAAQRIADRLKSSSPQAGQRPQDHITPDEGTTTQPNRTITNIYYGASQAKKGNQNG